MYVEILSIKLYTFKIGSQQKNCGNHIFNVFASDGQYNKGKILHGTWIYDTLYSIIK